MPPSGPHMEMFETDGRIRDLPKVDPRRRKPGYGFSISFVVIGRSLHAVQSSLLPNGVIVDLGSVSGKQPYSCRKVL